ncbi:MAG: CYTH and CHAD domain-containing protein [Burkholderiaceae bacterium]
MPSAEIELKLLLPGANAADIEDRLRGLAVLARRKAQTQWLWNRYYDTAEASLRTQRSALRLRCVSDAPWQPSPRGPVPKGKWIQTFKSAGTSLGGLSTRGEWESEQASGALDERALRETPWRQMDPRGELFAALRPCFDTRSRRTTWQLRRYQGAWIEVALDVGDIVAGEQSQPVLELELELKQGPAESLFALAHTIAQTIAVLPCDASKAERGYNLALGQRLRPRSAKAIALPPDATPLHAAQASLADAYEQITRNLAGLLHADDPELVHQARVGWRRWRSAGWLFSPWTGPMPDTADLKPLLIALGQMRDLDVLQIETLATWLPRFVEGDALRRRPAQRVVAQVAQAQAAQRERVRASLCSPPTGAALLRLAHALVEIAEAARANGATGAPRKAEKRKAKKHGKAGERHNQAKGTPWATARMATVRTQLERTLKASNQPDASTTLIHRARLKAKRARYAAEMLHDVLPPHSGVKLARRATAIQTRVGQDRDMQQAIALLQAMEVDARLIGFLQGVRAGRAASA